MGVGAKLQLGETQRGELQARQDTFRSSLETFLEGSLGDRESFINAWVRYEVYLQEQCFPGGQESQWEVARAEIESELATVLGVASIIGIEDAVAQASRRERRLVEQERDVGMICRYFEVKHVARGGVMVAPDSIETPPAGMAEEEFKRSIRYQPRLQMLIRELTTEPEIKASGIQVTSGELRDNQMRTISYALIEVEGVVGGILVCNQVGEVTYVNFQSEDITFYETKGKQALNANPNLTRVVCRNLYSWRDNVVDLFLGRKQLAQVAGVLQIGDQTEEELDKHIQIIRLLEEIGIDSIDSKLKFKKLGRLLGLRENQQINQTAIARELVAQGYFPARVPEDYNLEMNYQQLRYLKPEVVGKEQAEANKRKAIEDWIRTCKITLDSNIKMRNLGNLLGLEEGMVREHQTLIAKALVKQGYLPARAPENYNFQGKYKQLRYFDPEVVGAKQAEANKRKAIEDWIKKDEVTLDNVPQLHIVGRLLGVGTGNQLHAKTLIAKALVDRGYLSGVAPDDYDFKGAGHPLRYFDPDIVGGDQAEANKRKAIEDWIAREEMTLDRVPKLAALGSLLGVVGSRDKRDKDNKNRIAEALVGRGYFSAAVPKDYDFEGVGNPMRYFNPDIVGNDQAEANKRKAISDWIVRKQITLDNVPQSHALCAVLGLGNEFHQGLAAKALVDQGYFSAVVPDGYIFTGNGNPLRYLNPDIVGSDQAEANKRKAILDWIARDRITSDNVPPSTVLARLLGLDSSDQRKVTSIRKALVEHGYLRVE